MTAPSRRRTLAAAAAALSLTLLAGCGGSTSSDVLAPGPAQNDVAGQNAGGGKVTNGSAPAPAKGTVAEEPTTTGATNGPAAVPQPAGPALARTAALSLEVKAADFTNAAAQVRGVARTYGGLVLSEDLTSLTGSTVDAKGVLTLGIPSARLDEAMDALAKVGTVRNRSASSEDVTSQTIDTEARLKTMRASVDRVRALMAQATKLGEVVALESEVSRREADLEALESQLASLKARVAMSPVTVNLFTPSGDSPVVEPEQGTGFLAGLRSGWRAFTESVQVVLTVLGALLPWAVVAGLVAWVVLWWRRRMATAPAEGVSSSGGDLVDEVDDAREDVRVG